MKIDRSMTALQVTTEIGDRLARMRLHANMKQTELARQIGCSRKLLARLESHGAGKLENVVAVAMALGRIDELDSILPDIDCTTRDNTPRKRAYRHRSGGLSHKHTSTNTEKDPV